MLGTTGLLLHLLWYTLVDRIVDLLSLKNTQARVAIAKWGIRFNHRCYRPFIKTTMPNHKFMKTLLSNHMHKYYEDICRTLDSVLFDLAEFDPTEVMYVF